MKRSFRRRSHSRSRSSRKTRWTGGIFQGLDQAFTGDVNGISLGQFSWVSFWFKWPASHFSPTIPGAVTTDVQQRLEPSDETLVRTINNFTAVASYDATADVDQSWAVAIGLIAWDGGKRPEAFDLAVHSSLGTAVAPPNPVVDFEDDWLLRNIWGVTNTNPSIFQTLTDSYVNSAAKRKLPPDTGILGLIGAADTIIGTNVLEMTWNWDVRMAIRSGYTA